MTASERKHFEVLLEQILHEVKVVAEGHATLEHMIHEHRTETQQDKRELQALIQTSHDSLDAKINKASTDLRDEMAAGFKVLGEKVEGHEDRIRFLERKAA